ncbi:Uncharacterised protein [Arcanobacterium haemolyticum]|nr:Uncharacterised protein [Arcanobacterium haemolyticum]
MALHKPRLLRKVLTQTPQYANTYRNRLIEAQMIYTPRTGYVDFELPYLREYLRTHAASLMTLTTY